MRRLIMVLGLALATCSAGCGNSNVVTPSEVAQNYLYAIAEGYFPGACALLDQHTRDRLFAVTMSSGGCSRLLARCVPKGSTALRRDQSQLLYANVELSVHGSRADARLSGTAVAKAAQEVMLEDEHGQWRLISPGKNITRCVHELTRHRRRARS